MRLTGRAAIAYAVAALAIVGANQARAQTQSGIRAKSMASDLGLPPRR